MLVLARQRDETIMIGDDIEVTVVDIRGDKVRLGVNAPRTVSVHRKEIYEAIRRENQAAARVLPEDIPTLGTAGGLPTAPARIRSATTAVSESAAAISIDSAPSINTEIE